MLNPRLRFAAAARRDLRSILQYTLTTWGEAQATSYATSLDETCASLADFPHLGKERPEIASGVRSLAVERHLILYRTDAHGIVVLRIVHGRMNLDDLRVP